MKTNKLTPEQQKILLDNIRLVYYVISNSFNIPRNDPRYEDIASIGTIGLIKAITTFDASKGFSLSSYAIRCIYNEIGLAFRKINKWERVLSLDSPIEDENGNTLALIDTLGDTNCNLEQTIICNKDLTQYLHIILNYLEHLEKLCMIYKIAGFKQKEIGMIYHISRTYVSRMQTRSIKKIKCVISEQIYYNEIFSVNYIGDFYFKITFKYLSKCNAAFIDFLQSLKSTSNSFNYITNEFDELITIYICDFVLLAKIIAKIHDLS